MQAIARARHVARTVARPILLLSAPAREAGTELLFRRQRSVWESVTVCSVVPWCPEARIGADADGVHTAVRMRVTLAIQTAHLPLAQAASDQLALVDIVDKRTTSGVVLKCE